MKGLKGAKLIIEGGGALLGLKRRNHVVLIALMLIMSLVAMGCGGPKTLVRMLAKTRMNLM